MLVLTCAFARSDTCGRARGGAHVRGRRLARGLARFRIRALDSVQLGKRLGLRERTAGESYLNFTKSVSYMLRISLSILIVQWFRRRT